MRRVTYRGPNRWHSDGRPPGYGAVMAQDRPRRGWLALALMVLVVAWGVM